MLRVVSYLLSILLHAGIVLGSLYWPVSQAHIDLNVPVYEVDLVTLAGAPGKPGDPGDPGPGEKPAEKPQEAPQAKKAEAPPEPPKAKEPPPPPEPKEPPKPVQQAKPEAKPQPVAKQPPPEKGKDISAQKKDEPKKPEPKKAEPEKKPEPKKPEPEKKPEPAKKPETKKAEPKPKEEPKPAAAATPKPKQQEQKQPSTREQILAQALQTARTDAAKQEKQDRDVLAKELAELRDSVTQGQGSGGGTGTGSAGQGGQGGQGGQSMAYLRAVATLIKERWSFPKLESSRVLTSTVEMRLDRNGEILDYQLINSSGRADFDASTLKAVAEAQQINLLPPPPKGLEVIRINFNSQELR